MDHISIPDLPLPCRIGVSEGERAAPQLVLIDVELYLDLAPAARQDDFRKTVDYVAVCEALSETAAARPRALIETLAEDSAAELLRRFPVDRVRLRVRKPSALEDFGAPCAAVEIERGRDG